MQSQSALRQAVEEQLDLILKIEEERKLLKKENRVLKEEHQKMMNTLKKYHVERTDQFSNTDPLEQPTQEKKKQPIQLDQAVQVDLDIPQTNTSKLSSAYDLLKQLNISSQNLCSRCEEQLINASHCESKEIKESRETKRSTAPSSNQQISNEIVKLAKEIAALKRQLKESDGRVRGREKELKEVKKCLQVKAEALEKSRKEFNQLSQLFNSDKYKSLRALQTENREIRARNSILEEQGKANAQLTKTLLQVTTQFQQYREDREARLSRLLAELKEKDSRCDQLTRELQKSYSL